MTTSDREELLRKAVRARSLTDPLGAMGFRTPSKSARIEARIRRIFFALTMLGFVGVLGAVIGTAPPETSAPENGAVAAAANLPSQSVRVNGAASQQQPSHTRTRGS